MAETLPGGRPSNAANAFGQATAAYLTEVSAGLYTTLSDADLLAELREVERLRRRQAACDHAILAEIETRGVAGRLALPGTSALLQAMLLLSPHEAKQRVTASADCTARSSVTGELLPPRWPLIAEAQSDGRLSIEQARVISRVLHRIPPTVATSEVDAAELSLVQAADSLRPYQLGQLGERILDYLNPDGMLASESEQERLRSLSLIRNSDGTYQLHAQLTGACGALLEVLLSAHAAPRPAADGTPDPRTYPQRMHDALQYLAGFEVRRTELIDSGAAVQLVITMTAEQFHQRSGWAETSFGQLIPATVALQLADEAALTLLIRDARGAVLAEGRTRRIASRAQTLALIARDRGCSFPDCDKPPEWTQRHHVVAWSEGGRTDVDNLTLLCAPHHRDFDKLGWRGIMRDGLPYWIPPAWIDPRQRPRQNQRISVCLRQ